MQGLSTGDWENRPKPICVCVHPILSPLGPGTRRGIAEVSCQPGWAAGWPARCETKEQRRSNETGLTTKEDRRSKSCTLLSTQPSNHLFRNDKRNRCPLRGVESLSILARGGRCGYGGNPPDKPGSRPQQHTDTAESHKLSRGSAPLMEIWQTCPTMQSSAELDDQGDASEVLTTDCRPHRFPWLHGRVVRMQNGLHEHVKTRAPGGALPRSRAYISSYSDKLAR